MPMDMCALNRNRNNMCLLCSKIVPAVKIMSRSFGLCEAHEEAWPYGTLLTI